MTLEDFVIYKYLKLPEQAMVSLGGKNQRGSLLAFVYIKPFWKKLPLKNKGWAIVKKKWMPSEEEILKEAELIFNQIFGQQSDYGLAVMRLQQWHHRRDWGISILNEQDEAKAKALEATVSLARAQVRNLGSKYLNLNLANHLPVLCSVMHGMIVKIPVQSLQYYLDIDVYYTFNSIRKSCHENADELIAYIYEVIFIQHKIFDCLLSYLKLMQKTRDEKGGSGFTTNELKLIKEGDACVGYLKASIEKTVALLAAIYSVKGIADKKTHKQRLAYLDASLPAFVKDAFYYNLVREFISSENLEDLNKYRTGLMHKKGISDLQPHQFANIPPEAQPAAKVYQFLHTQHIAGTAVLLGVLALLTDELVKLDPPDVSPWDIPQMELSDLTSTGLERFKAAFEELEDDKQQN